MAGGRLSVVNETVLEGLRMRSSISLGCFPDSCIPSSHTHTHSTLTFQHYYIDPFRGGYMDVMGCSHHTSLERVNEAQKGQNNLIGHT